MNSDELRTAYLKFFEARDHKILPSASLIPYGDPTLLLTNAGMVQFKPYFTGKAVPPSPRATTCQKCFRTNDIESVGDPTHLTFFEMLGNFSFGDYFKKEAIAWAWDFVISHLKMPRERLWITIFQDDDVAFDLWRSQGVPAARIVRLGEEDNFWGPAGTSGPCGPCSEIHYDLGEEFGCGKSDCEPGCDCKRFTEIWNLVFPEFNQAEDGTRTKLPEPGIDTGMGFERVLMLLQDKPTPYETDLFAGAMAKIQELAGKKYGTDPVSDNSMRVLADHGRGVTFLLADGVMPGKEGRGYVLRRILRRAEYFGETLAYEKPFLTAVAEEIVKKMGHIYPELVANRHHILAVISAEVDSFRKSLPVGKGMLQDRFIAPRERWRRQFPELEKDINVALAAKNTQNLLKAIGSTVKALSEACPALNRTQEVGSKDPCAEVFRPLKEQLLSMEAAVSAAGSDFQAVEKDLRDGFVSFRESSEKASGGVSGPEAFTLHDTYGFPIDLTREIAGRRGFTVDMGGFEQEMEKQRERAKAAQKFYAAGGAGPELDLPPTVFTGYEQLVSDSSIAAIIVDGESVGVAREGQEAGIVLEATPFYGEMGGQVGDTGEIESESGHFAVTDTARIADGAIILHRGKVVNGGLSVEDKVRAEVNAARRMDIACNHTATHLLQYALRKVLGGQVQQRGSLVTPDRFRFDFSQLVALSPEQLQQVQRIVNDLIRQDLLVFAEQLPYKRAVAEGAIALFDEKYGDVVRTLKVGRPPVSIELCGGTHIGSTGQIGVLQILSESSIGSGLRRIEAVTGRGAEEYIEKLVAERRQVARAVGASGDDVVEKLRAALDAFEQEKKQKQAIEREFARREAELLLTKKEVVNGVTVLAARVPSLPPQALREMGDFLRDKLKSAIIVLVTVFEGRASFLALVTPDLVSRGYDAAKIVKQVAQRAGGSGGGRPSMAQAGTADIGKVDVAVASTVQVVRGPISLPPEP